MQGYEPTATPAQTMTPNETTKREREDGKESANRPLRMLVYAVQRVLLLER